MALAPRKAGDPRPVPFELAHEVAAEEALGTGYKRASICPVISGTNHGASRR